MAVAAIAGTAAAAAYLDAKFHIRHDLTAGSLVNTAAKAQAFLAEREAQNKLLIYNVFEDQAHKQPDRLFLEFENRSWTYKQFFDSLQRVGNWLINDLGIQKGEMIALDGPNSAEYIMLWLALEGIGAGVAFINSNLTGNSLTHSVKLCGTRYLITERGIEDLVKPHIDELGEAGVAVVYYDTNSIDDLRDSTPLPEERRKGVKVSDVLKVSTSELSNDHAIFTVTNDQSSLFIPLARRKMLLHMRNILILTPKSGLPKGVMGSIGRSLNTTRSIAQYLKLTPDDKFYTCLPLYHGAGQSLCTTPCIWAGASMRLSRKFSHKTFWPEVHESKANILQYVGELCRYLVNAPVHPLERNHNVRQAWGNGMRPDVWERFRQRFSIPVIHELYAATDGMGATFNYNKGEFSRNAIAVRGLIWNLRNGKNEVRARIDPDTEDIVRGRDGHVIQAKIDEPGEVLHRVDPKVKAAAFRGYFKNEDASEKRWMTNVFEAGDLWFRSGDVMRMDADGRVFFVDRLGDTFRWRSENVSTNEVADVVGSFHQIAETNVYGVAVPNADGRCGCAMLVLKPPNTAQTLDLQGLAQFILSKLPRYAVPIFLRVAEQISYTGTMKMQKGQAKKEGADLDLIERAGSRDQLFWLPPNAKSYQPYRREDWVALRDGRVRL